MNVRFAVAIGFAVCTLVALGVALGQLPQGRSDRERFYKLFAAGNFQDAYAGYRALALDSKTEPDRVGADLKRAIECLVHLGRIDEVDSFRDGVVAVHQSNWRLL